MYCGYFYFYIVGVISCVGLKNVGFVFVDGEYFIYVYMECDMLIKVYCYGMNISFLKEFIILFFGV